MPVGTGSEGLRTAFVERVGALGFGWLSVVIGAMLDDAIEW